MSSSPNGAEASRLNLVAMQTSASKSIAPKGSAQVSKGKTTSSQQQGSSKIRSTSGGDSSAVAGGNRTKILIDGKIDVTPRSLVPAHYMQPQAGQGQILTSVPEAAVPDDGGHEDAQQQPERVKPVKPAGLSKEELECNIDIILAETETETLLTFPSLCVALDNPMSATISARNKAYDELCVAKADSAQYREQHVQTLNHPHKAKEVWAPPPSQESVEVAANGWDIYDTFATDPMPRHEQIQMACEKESAAIVAQAIKKPGCLFTMNEPYPNHDQPKEQQQKERKAKQGGRQGHQGQVGGAMQAGTSSAVRQAGNSASVPPGVGSCNVSGARNGGAMVGAHASEVQNSNNAPGAEAATGATNGGQSSTPAGGAAAEGEPNAAAGGEDGVLASEDAPGDAVETEVEVEALKAPPEILPWKAGADQPIPDEMAQAVKVMERIVAQNVFHKQHMIYRNYPTMEELARLDELRAEESHADGNNAVQGERSTVAGTVVGVDTSGDCAIAEEGEGEGGNTMMEEHQSDLDGRTQENKPSLEDLFCFDAPQLTQGTTVTCAEWNRHNQDLLAVSYGDTTPVPSTPGGLVLFWSLKNPTYPERVIRTKQGVTALHFSSVHPNMVAAGTHDGSVMIWDLRRPSDQPVLRSGSSTSQQNDQKHTDIVWETRWVDQGPEKQPPELLVSVSSDGNVLQWSMKKGLEQQLLMPLKRVPNKQLGANSVYGHKEGIVFRKSSGFCIDFPRHDPATYMVGTEDGLVHRCSTSYNEQYLETYCGHSGPVYRVRCNPFMSHAFLTCSADWTIRLWTTKPVPGHQTDSPLLTFQSTDLNDAVNDVIWAPQNSTSFAAAMDDGRVELWDLSEKPLDPIVVHYPQGQGLQRRRTCVRFSPNSPVLISGDDRGSVVVMRMYNTNQSYYSDQEQQERLNAVMVKKR